MHDENTTRSKAIDCGKFEDELLKVKGCACALTALYVQDAGLLTYSDEFLMLLSRNLHDAAEYFDKVLGTLEA